MPVYINECPICGGRAELSRANEDRNGCKALDAYFCECPACGKSTDEFLTEEEAVNIWNNSRSTDLRDTGERIVRSAVVKPLLVFLHTFLRVLLLLVGPVLLFFLVFSANYDIAWWLWVTYGIILLIWLGFGIPAYVKFAGQRNRLIRHIPKEKRPMNRLAIMMGDFAAVIAHQLIFLYILMPIAVVNQNVGHIPFK
ncbi:MAG TPA: hypothetical protein PK854_08600 [Oscillospiraceae bacterium]|nr:hypothetical protein [Oscillospiraceae bacterium]HPS35311.1 hypothetical protein [Oscillospiraceae bacterium]